VGAKFLKRHKLSFTLGNPTKYGWISYPTEIQTSVRHIVDITINTIELSVWIYTVAEPGKKNSDEPPKLVIIMIIKSPHCG